MCGRTACGWTIVDYESSVLAPVRFRTAEVDTAWPGAVTSRPG